MIEDRIIDKLKALFPAPSNVMGIGDDCAVIPIEGGKALLVTTDALAEGIHFLPDIAPEDLAYKVLAVNVSDIAAMGGKARYAFISASLPKHCDQDWMDAFITALKKETEYFDLALLGGDTTGAKNDLFLSLTLIGEAELTKVRYRHLAQAGDAICTTGFLGDSAGGLNLLLEKSKTNTPEEKYLIRAHLHPIIGIKEALWLAEQPGVHAMMDLSDGVNQDLARLCIASACAASIRIDNIPISSELQHVASQKKWNLWQLALSGGEDYHLLLTVADQHKKTIQEQYIRRFGKPLYEIGHIVKADVDNLAGTIKYAQQEHEVSLQLQNFDHFKLDH